MIRNVLQKLLDNWEQMLFAIALLLLVLFGTIVALFSAQDETDENSARKKIDATQYFKWGDSTSLFVAPKLPHPDNANPFAHTLVARPPKPDAPAQQNIAAAQSAPPTPQPERPKDTEKVQPATPPKPIHTVTIGYRGLYVGVSGEAIAMLTATDSTDKSTQTFRIRQGQTFLNAFTLTAVTDTDATIQTADGQLKSIPWNDSFAFEQE